MSIPPRFHLAAIAKAAEIADRVDKVHTTLDAAEESLVVARRHIDRPPPTRRELEAEVHGCAHLGVFFLDRGQDPLAFTSHPDSVEQDCYDATVVALGFDPLDGEREVAA
jgi:hypothetical protein